MTTPENDNLISPPACFVSRRRFMQLLACLPLLPTGAGCRRQPAAPLRIAAHLWPGYEFMFFARQQGWLDEGQVTLVETPSATSSIEMLTRGSVDGAALTLDEVLRTRAFGIPLTVVLVFNISAGADMLLVHPEIKNLQELAGCRIGVERGALGALMLSKILDLADLDKAAVEVVSLPVNQHESAFTSRRVDAVITYEPVAGQLQQQGALRLFDSRALPDLIFDVLAISSDLLPRIKDALAHLAAVHFRALDYYRRNTLDASYRLAHRFGLRIDQVQAAFRGLKLPTLQENIRLLSGSPEPLVSAADQLLDILVEADLLLTRHPLIRLVTPDVLTGIRSR